MRAKLFVVALCGTVLTACGIKGPLYLPAPKPATAPAGTQPGPDVDHTKPFTPPDARQLPGVPSR